VGPTRRAGAQATIGPGHVSGVVSRWPRAGLGKRGLAGWGGKMSAKKDGPNAVGSFLTRPVLRAPRIATVLKMFANSRVMVRYYPKPNI
jgi:hypothetical protein